MCLGSNTDGQLGLGNFRDTHTMTELKLSNIINIYCGGHYTVALNSDLTCCSWGWNIYGQLALGHTNKVCVPTKINLENIVSVCCAFRNMILLTKSGDIYCTRNKILVKLSVSNVSKIYANTYKPHVQTMNGQIYLFNEVKQKSHRTHISVNGPIDDIYGTETMLIVQTPHEIYIQKDRIFNKLVI